jgi:hypothetical protein
MAKATKFTAIHDGHAFKRSSQNRIYTHTVIVGVNISVARDEAKLSASASYEMNLKWHQSWLDGTCEYLVKASYDTQERHDADVKQHIETATRVVNGGLEGAIAESLARFDNEMSNSLISTDGTMFYYNAGWCGREDLAIKLASQKLKAGRKSFIVSVVQS